MIQFNEELETANKLIFVKRYEDAALILDHLQTHYQNRDLTLVHLRQIELAVKLSRSDALIETYQKQLESADESFKRQLEIALILAEQHCEALPPHEAAAQMKAHITQHGGSAGAYYGIAFSMEVTQNFERALFNYEQCINCDPSFYPGFFGISQVYYQMGDDAKGDYYFRLFENAAPYNVYGNFETHRELSMEFLAFEEYELAEEAIYTLREWWIENKGGCPPEIQIYEALVLHRIAEYQQDDATTKLRLAHLRSLTQELLHFDEEIELGIFYFIAKALEEFSHNELALKFYKKILSRETIDPDLVQKIGSQFISLGEYKLSRQIFQEAYENNPDNEEIQFCLLVSKLREAEVNVEEYLLAKERLRQLVSHGGDRVQLLSLLHNLLALFDGDATVHFHLGEIYARMGNLNRARKHFEKMIEIDPKSKTSSLRYAAFEIQYGDLESAEESLKKVAITDQMSPSDHNELHWLQATLHLRKGEHQKSRVNLAKALAMDPWNVSYLVYDIINQLQTANLPQDNQLIDPLLQRLMVGDESNLDWRAYNHRTLELNKLHKVELVYVREKLRFLYAQDSNDAIKALLNAACRFDAGKAIHDFLKLLNTNFDGPQIYWALGMLSKENWQLESASLWFEQILNLPLKDKFYHSTALLELADCYVWRSLQYDKAVEYVKIAMSMREEQKGKSLTILAHAMLKLGQVKEASIHLESTQTDHDPEATYLKGLVQYRNGSKQAANEIWKPLLTVRSENLRFHHIKQEILKYYFEGAPYTGVTLS